MLFKDVPIWAHFFLRHVDDVCLKVSPATAVDRSCAKGWCFEVRADEACDLAVRRDAPAARAVASTSIESRPMRIALDRRYLTGGRASRDRTMILDIDSLGDFPLDSEAGGPLDAPDELPAGSCNSVEVRRGPWHLDGGRGVPVGCVTHVLRDGSQVEAGHV